MDRLDSLDGSSLGPLYREEQSFRQWWLWVIVLGVAAVAWWGFIQQILVGRPFGNNPAPDWTVWLIWVVIGLGLPLLFGFLKLVVEVMPSEIHVRFWPFSGRVIRVAEIEGVQVRRYNAVAEYGGWGIKGWSTRKVAYNVSGDRGVDLTLRNGRRVLLGSQKSEELAAAIEAQRRLGGVGGHSRSATVEKCDCS